MMMDRKNHAQRTGGHPTWNDLARLVDVGTEDADSTVLHHLATCAECQVAWAEAVRYRSARLSGSGEYSVPEELAARARNLVGAGSSKRQTNTNSSPRRWRPVPILSVGGTLVAAALALFIILPALNSTDESRTVISAILERQSARGMVYPGVTGTEYSDLPIYRSGDGIAAPFELAIDQVNETWRKNPHDPENTWWLAAGNAAAGRLGLASDLVHQGLRRNPDHLRLLHLDAITAWRLSEFERAEQTLSRILILSPSDDTARFNLALVLIQTNRPNAATKLMRELSTESQNPWLRQRAQDYLTTGE